MEMRVLGSERSLKVALQHVPPSMMPDGIKGGDTKIIWNRDNRDEVDSARATFDRLKGAGYSVFECVGKEGNKGKQIFTFDPNAERLMFIPPLRGGC
jgi:hypothetical protein